MAKIVRLTESDLNRIVRRVILEKNEHKMGEKELERVISDYDEEVKKAHSMSITDLEIILDELTNLGKKISKNEKLDSKTRFKLQKSIYWTKRNIQSDIDSKVDENR